MIACVVATCAASVLLYSGDGPITEVAVQSAQWNPVLAFFARAFTLPIPTAGPADVREVVLPCGLLILLLVYATAPRLHARTDPVWRLPNLPLRWLVLTGSLTLFIALLSASVNQSWALSWGWLVRMAAGLLWAAVIARMFTGRMIRHAVTGLIAVAVTSLVLTVSQRADRHLANFIWPIGPITPTATMSALWAAMAGGIVVGSRTRRSSLGAIASFAAVFVLSIYVLAQSGRRGAALALLATTVLCLAHFVWWSTRRGSIRVALAGVMIASIAGSVAYVAKEWRDPDRVASGSVSYRFEYWRLSADLILDRLSLGYGPDTFVAEMTNTIAPLRGISPHVYHGNSDPAAHNEWIQAGVELGVPGAMFWLMLPLGVVFLAWRSPSMGGGMSASMRDPAVRRRFIFGDPAVRPLSLALGAGVLVIVIAEASGVLLRSSILPVWYWTLLGLLCACASSAHSIYATPPASPSASLAHGRTLPRVLATLIACALGFVVYMEMAGAARDHARRVVTSGALDLRLNSYSTLALWREAAIVATAIPGQSSSDEMKKIAVERWQKLYEVIPGWLDTCARYALALLEVNERDSARRVLDTCLRRDLNAYEPMANIVHAQQFATGPVEKLQCMERALRHAGIDVNIAEILRSMTADPAAIAYLAEKAPRALQQIDATTRNNSPVAWDDVSGEILRMDAFVRWQNGAHAEAIHHQRYAAVWYTWLESENSAYRRDHDAEVSAWYTLARWLHEAHPGNFDEAYRAIIAAERFAVLGIKHEQVAEPDPSAGFVGGEVVPTECPEHLRPLWRLSALLHVMVGDESYLAIRILGYVPPDQWSDQTIPFEQMKLYRQAVDELSKLPPEGRPPHYDELVKTVSAPSVG